MKTSESIIQIAPALLAAQKLIGAASKTAENPFFKSKYADLGEVIEVCKEHLNANGIAVLQPVSNGDGDSTYVETILLHESGEFISSKMKVALKDKENPQAQGSAITYARRYSLQSMVLIPAEDDDGEGAMKQEAQRAPDSIVRVLGEGPFPVETPKLPIDPSTGLSPEHKRLFLLLSKAVDKWQQPMGDILYRLTTFMGKDKKTGNPIQIKGKYVLKEISDNRARVAADKLEKQLAKSDSQVIDENDDVTY